MKRTFAKIQTVAHKSKNVIKTEGPIGLARRSGVFAYYRILPHKRKRTQKDILFINGCGLPHPSRYRVDHQVEQLAAAGISADTVFYENLDIESLKYYRGFIFFRCPVTETVSQFIKQAKFYNKTCIYDVDDLVIDQKYTDQVKYVQQMNKQEKALYNNGVDRMRATLEQCDLAITTTSRLQKELAHYIKTVHVNRNVASDEMIYTSLEAARFAKKDSKRIVLGYFSGTITHNEDFELMLPALIKILKKYDNVYIKVVGILDIPEELQEFKDRIISIDFMEWRDMPKEVATCDLVVAPLVKNIFNEAKSENKWTEASLVSVPTVASNFGAFKEVVTHGKDGYLIEDQDWFDALDTLVKDANLRAMLGANAHSKVISMHTTVGNASKYAKIIEKELARNIAFALPSIDISGGVNVVLKHADILRNNGWDVTLVDTIDPKTLKKATRTYDYRRSMSGYNVITACESELVGYFDTMVATLWATLEFVKAYPNVKRRLYFVQGYETDFTKHGGGEPRFLANATYCDKTGIEYITMSPWCEEWLAERFGKAAKRFSNGLTLSQYPIRKRDFAPGKKVKILIEGDSKSAYKNTDEAFRIIDRLSKDDYHVSYLSYHKEPKAWYRVDRFYNRISPEEVGKIYADCDILIKTSLLESFSYPPLEMMATGGLVVAILNDGNKEFLVDKKNCLLYESGDIDAGVRAVEILVQDEKLRVNLIRGGLETAARYDWGLVEEGILDAYTEA